MSKSYSIGDLMAMYYENEFLAVEEVVLPQFSAKHNRKMKKVFDIFAKNIVSTHSQPMTTVSKRPLSIRKQILIAAIIIVSLAFITGCVIAFISNSFRGTVYYDNTYLFAFDVGDSPTVIEEEYILSIVPEGYQLYDSLTGNINSSKLYRNSLNKEFVFMQTVKSEYNSHINTEEFSIQEIDINGCNGVCIEYVSEVGIHSIVIWNSSEYILELYGDFAKETLIDLANSNEIIGF
ncbi:MAG: DUF4367 domain-containing protein [Oscillospiraceae bacterium]